jgi:hypothetical protein
MGFETVTIGAVLRFNVRMQSGGSHGMTRGVSESNDFVK